MEYKIKQASENDISVHLQKCDSTFIPPLSARIDIAAYSKKLFERSVTFEAWEGKMLTGLVAAYINGEDNYAFITNVSVLPECKGLGIASQLLNNCREYALKNGIGKILLEVNKDNAPVISLYKKFDFVAEGEKGTDLIMRLQLSKEEA